MSDQGIWLEQSDFDNQLNQLLSQERYTEADAFVSHWGQISDDEYKMRKKRYYNDHEEKRVIEQCRKEAEEREKIQEEVRSLLYDANYNKADRLYERSCTDWWSLADYEAEKPQARLIHQSTLWASYNDALKLIMTGSTSQTLSSEQNAIYLNMLNQGIKDNSGNQTEERQLPGVQTQQYCEDIERNEHETQYYIPDLFRYMLGVFQEWCIFNPPVDLNYLNSLRDEAGESLFMFSNAPGHKEWEQSKEGQRHWKLLCRKMKIENDIAELQKTHHVNDPLKLKAQKRMEGQLKTKLRKVIKNLQKIETIGETNQYKANVHAPIQKDWKPIARKLGGDYCKKLPYLSIDQVAMKVHEELKQQGITGRGNRVPTAATIKRHALTGIKSEK